MTFLGIPVFAERALCAELEPQDHLWFPDNRGVGGIQEARRICRSCPAQAECLETALAIPGVHGIWAGTTEGQRSRMRTKRRVLERVAAKYGRELEK